MTGREVLACDLYGTLFDPIAVSSELGRFSVTLSDNSTSQGQP